MKTISTIAAALIFGTTAFGQEPTDTTRIQIGDMKVIMIDEGGDDSDSTSVEWDYDECDKSELTYWDGVDVGMNILLNADGKTTFEGADEWLELDYARSLSWRINIMEGKIRLVKDYVGLVVGAGLTYNSYTLKNNYTVANVNDSTFGVRDTILDFSKNKLRASYVNVPLLLEFNTSDDCDKNFHLSAGVIGGWRMGSITKQRYDFEGNDVRQRVKNDYNMRDFTLDATVRLGYRNVTLFATYGLTPMFEDKKGPEVYPVTIGINLVPFS
jgi:hypothetical protein